MPLQKIHHLLQDELAATDALIIEKLQSQVDLTHEIGHHITKSGGKRLRPLLTLLSGKLLGYSDTPLIVAAAIIELIHTATLLHDDVIDNSSLRRGNPTANTVWGNQASVLVGDFLYSRAFQMLSELKNIAILDTLANSTIVIAEGEILQLQNCNNPEVSEENYRQVIERKTGTLFAAAAQMGALLAKRAPQDIKHLGDYGMHLGTAFQLIDDALDYCADTKQTGKNLGDDLAEGKPTLPLIRVLAVGNEKEKSLVRTAITTGKIEHLHDILAAIHRNHAIEYTQTIAKRHAELAISHLSSFDDSIYRQALINLAEFAVARAF